MPRIGVLWHTGSAEEEEVYLRALRKGFSDLGYVEGKNIVLENRFPNEQPENFRTMAMELVESKVDVVHSLARPGGNVTGLSLMIIDLSEKRLGLFKELVPYLTRVAILIDPPGGFSTRIRAGYEKSARAMRFVTHIIEVTSPNEIDQAFFLGFSAWMRRSSHCWPYVAQCEGAGRCVSLDTQGTHAFRSGRDG